MKREKLITRTVNKHEVTYKKVGEDGKIKEVEKVQNIEVRDVAPTQAELNALSEAEGATVFVMSDNIVSETYGIPFSVFMENARLIKTNEE